ncbi:hypothetical protein R69776_01138 [Paraburkholderia nemoris]|uniref:Uncharacterized protein n=1 Tax=Paraburkholderia nemoris TaxID=2793076 RepID=A0ABN7KTF8_9BURK|nr:hypothetical protein R69776_01138 [Paraburkholderia nemoris]
MKYDFYEAFPCISDSVKGLNQSVRRPEQASVVFSIKKR